MAPVACQTTLFGRVLEVAAPGAKLLSTVAGLLRSFNRLISCCCLQMLYETASSCLVGKLNKKGRPHKNVTCQCRKTTLHPMCSAEFPDLLHYKYQRALVPPGEAVGMLAAQVDISFGFI